MLRPIDKLGRVCIPKEWRYQLDIEEGEHICLSLDLENQCITIKKQVEFFKCPFCGETDTSKLHYFKKSQICEECEKELSNK